ncbi:zinc finger protein 62 homolog isoform X2 [Macrosteles quadrilineatus]|uniref:zinc finger protein 62 homolog isoform X2 n=1 Tax=Macrosteles quadrilineatus TaxID=74068 RepID=UPI0023E2AC94|nr:zinc finger protein 62 homolog isoform X2 [Macrosteles quadrilineatus]
MSQLEDPSNDKVASDEAESSKFAFINVEESIKKETVEEHIEDVYNEEEKQDVICESSQDSLINPLIEIDENSSTFGSEVVDEAFSTEEVSQHTDPNATKQAFLCDKCSISFVSPNFLEAHKKRCRARMEETANEQSTVDETIDSNKTTTRCKKKSRIPAGELKYKCETCEKGFVRLKNLEAHMATHSVEFKCEKCPYTTEHRRNLMRHVVVHFGEDEKKYSCPYCSYTAGKSSYLRIHVARHLDEKPHKCTVCSYGTAVLDTLNKHMATHTGQREFACSHCYYSAAKKSQLAKHLQKFHSEEGNNT